MSPRRAGHAAEQGRVGVQATRPGDRSPSSSLSEATDELIAWALRRTGRVSGAASRARARRDADPDQADGPEAQEALLDGDAPRCGRGSSSPRPPGGRGRPADEVADHDADHRKDAGPGKERLRVRQPAGDDARHQIADGQAGLGGCGRRLRGAQGPGPCPAARLSSRRRRSPAAPPRRLGGRRRLRRLGRRPEHLGEVGGERSTSLAETSAITPWPIAARRR